MIEEFGLFFKNAIISKRSVRSRSFTVTLRALFSNAARFALAMAEALAAANAMLKRFSCSDKKAAPTKLYAFCPLRLAME